MNALKMTFALLVVIVILFILALNYKPVQVKEGFSIINLKDAKCHIEKNTCSIDNDVFNLKLSISENLTYLKPFTVIATSETKNNSRINKILLNFKMKGMVMGVNRILLKTDNPATQQQYWQGSGILPICVAGRADWVAELEVYTNASRYRLTFPVIVQKVNN